VSDCETYSIALLIAFGSPVPQPTEWQRIDNQIDAAFIFARSDFVNVVIRLRRSVQSSCPEGIGKIPMVKS
jgi:hypothetical protein